MENCFGNILLVGEGDFSFSVAFAKRILSKYDNKQFTCETETLREKKAKNMRDRIISTCLLPKEQLFETHKAAKENIRIIEEIGATVCYEVDATKLDQCDTLKNITLDYVIFNFPHIGGKSNIKKNRQLLKDFFASVVSRLNPDSTVLISLARGQGGTPVDQPIRAWHDSWQVVTAAAYVDMVMTSVTPFITSDWQEYCSTGFRSMDRSFFMGGALTYHFKQAEPLPVRSYQCEPELVTSIVDGREIRVNQYIADKLKRDLFQNSHHPITLTLRSLETNIKRNFDSCNIVNLGNIGGKIVKLADSCINSKNNHQEAGVRNQSMLEPSIQHLVNSRKTLINQYFNLEICLDTSHSKDISDSVSKSPFIASNKAFDSDVSSTYHNNVTDETGATHLTNGMIDKNRTPHVTDFNLSTNKSLEGHTEEISKSVSSNSFMNSPKSSSNFVLRSTLLDCGQAFDSVDTNDKSVIFGHGQVYRRVWCNPNSHPVQHEFVMLIKHENLEALTEKITKITSGVLSASCHVSVDKTPEVVPKWVEQYLSKPACIEVAYKDDNTFHTHSCNQVGPSGPPSIVNRDSIKQMKFSKPVAFVGEVNRDTMFKKKSVDGGCDTNHDKPSLMAVIINLDSLCQIRYDIPDQRLLWSENPQFFAQFLNAVNHEKERRVYRPLSYHPPLWRHDLSFWEREDEMFNEEKFLDLVYDIAKDAIERVMLMNVWKDPETHRVSKCYRQIYQSHDRAISHEKAHEFQNALRLSVAKCHGVELR